MMAHDCLPRAASVACTAGALVDLLLQWRPTATTLPGRLEELYILMYEVRAVRFLRVLHPDAFCGASDSRSTIPHWSARGVQHAPTRRDAPRTATLAPRTAAHVAMRRPTSIATHVFGRFR